MPRGLTPSGRKILAPCRRCFNEKLSAFAKNESDIALRHSAPRGLIGEHAGTCRACSGQCLGDKSGVCADSHADQECAGRERERGSNSLTAT